MSISALSSTSAASQLSAFSRLGGGSNTGSTSGAGGTRPSKPDDGAFLDAISSALSSIGVTVDASDGDSATEGTGAAGSGDVGQALGAFLHQLMGSLHAQSGGATGAQEEGGEPPSGPPPGGGARGGPGNIESDLQSLLQKFSTSGNDGSDSAQSADSSVTDLQSSFASLLSALGGDEGGGSSKLGSFLQALSGSLGAASAGGSLSASGNLVNTTA
ncbi:hypothetical protein BZG29_17480 [Janthinobacterium sp. LM6]|uniref:hypothetical protein n=1 Tax=Janthinobacterium sp. LM6 TaxID=1938606 RepID=UPI000983C68D|nr:hypothetical protein [Janthinobacterium sp. LM6]AQR69918.1 hypothetical protein BZG29_17480 [Janthinobacterium sp. LM6]